MNRTVLLAVCIIALAGCGPSGGGASASSTPSATLPASNAAAPNGGISITRYVSPSILIEAESGAINPPMALEEDKDASQGKYVIAPEGPDHKEISIGGDVTYRVRVAQPGDYFLWVRANWSGGCGNSMDLSLDGERLGTVEDSVFDTWHWVLLQKPLRNLTAGDHLLTLGNREDGSGVDQILLVQDADYRPAGIESLDAQGRTSGLAPAAPETTTTTSAP